MASPEGQITTKYGIEGVDWEANGDKVICRRNNEFDQNGSLVMKASIVILL
ncbi:hypothetical protein FHS15_002898 [Paenibacillus castaneae]|uniref:hypothetical protein n=1 Tax=Paenibacillus castaneae TaxID=474957 RepID=UPI00141AFB8C|nr:hypothetical protein [Paenibacillus castaneae]NIK77760.1 hypothetical protein [Paenibacillus castaneae]